MVRNIILKCFYFHRYAIIEGSNFVKIFRNFKERMAFKPEFGAEGELYFLFSFHLIQLFLCIQHVSVCLAYLKLSILLSCRDLWWLLIGSEVEEWPGLLRLGEH